MLHLEHQGSKSLSKRGTQPVIIMILLQVYLSAINCCHRTSTYYISTIYKFQVPQGSVSNYRHSALHLCLKFSCPFLSSRCNSCFFSSVLLTSLSPRSLQRASKDFKGSNMSCLRPFVHSLKISDLIHCLFHPLALLKHS